MNKRLLSLFFFFISVVVLAQAERFPIFSECEDLEILNSEACFKSQLRSVVTKDFKIPKAVSDDNFNGILCAICS
mgnify:FL=1